MTSNAKTAIRAATLRNSIGNYAAHRMVERAGCPVSLYRLARQLLAAS